jgi:hypothetical protein
MQSKWSPERIAQQIVTAAVKASGKEGFNGTGIEDITSESGRVDPADPHEDDSWAVAVRAECGSSISSPAVSPLCWIFRLQPSPALFCSA